MSIIRVIDFETSHFELPEAEVCEVGYCDVDTDGFVIGEPISWLCGVNSMSPEARAVHHIVMSDCYGLPPFRADDVHSGHVEFLCAHNVDFELKFIEPYLPVMCTYKGALRMWPGARAWGNSVLRYALEDEGVIVGLDRGRAEPAHRAGPDAYVTAHILVALLKAGASVADMVAWAKEPRLLPRCPIGKFKDVAWHKVDTGFLGWMVRKDDMEADYRWNAQRELDRRS